MALKDFLALADDKLSAEYEKAAFNVEKARADIKARLQKASEQFTATEPSRGRKMWSVNNNVVKLSLPFSVDGKNTIFIPSERFADALQKLGVAVDKGELDKEIEAGVPDQPATRTRRASSGGGGGKGWTEERRARFAETIAARNAAKNK